MKHAVPILLAFAVSLLLAALDAHAQPAPRQRLSLDAAWRFQLGDLPTGAPAGTPIEKWRWKAGGAKDETMAAPDLDTSGSGWKDAAPGKDVFNGGAGFAWFRAVLPELKEKGRIIAFDSVDDSAVVYLNGQKLMHHEGWDQPFEVPLDAAWHEGGPNVLAVLVENTDGAGGIGAAALQVRTGPVTVTSGPASVGFDDAAWRSVDVPHDFVIEGTFDPKTDVSHGFLPFGVGWYRKSFTLPAADKGKRLFVDFDGVYRNSTVWLNGHPLGTQPSGYISFRYEITDVANYGGPNVLAVRADCRHSEGWWYEGGGIYRHVWLVKTEPMHIAQWGTFVTAKPSDDLKSAALTIKTSLVNQSDSPAQCIVVSTVVSPKGRTLQMRSEVSVPAGQEVETTQQQDTADPELWSPETPNLYMLVTSVASGGKIVDFDRTNFGIRSIRFDADQGFFLNGKPVKFKGTCNHQDFAGVGVALPDRIYAYKVEKLKAMGSNAFRYSHHPMAPELMDACDRLGMLVMDESRHLGDTSSGKTPSGTPYDKLTELTSMVKRDRNHPSIVIWSLCNEEPLQGSDEGARISAAMKKRIEELDGTRPVTAAMNGGWGSGLSKIVDVQGFNYGPGGYDGYHKAHPQQPLVGTETASAVSTRGIYANDKERGYVSAYDVNRPGWGQTAEQAWRPLADKPFMSGGFVWTGFDYRGEPTPYAWPCINSHFGIMDTCGFPKDSYYYYLSWWSDKTVLHLLPHWNWPGQEGQNIEVWAHSNCDKVELFLNGASLGAKEMPRNGHLEWKVAYAPGKLEAKGFKDGQEVAHDVVETTGAPAALRLTPDRASLKADGQDVAVVAVRVLDDQGRVVPTASDEVSFSVTGDAKIIGVGNGDPSSHEPDKATKRHAFNGLCLVIVQTGTKGGQFQLTATASGLKPTNIAAMPRTGSNLYIGSEVGF